MLIFVVMTGRSFTEATASVRVFVERSLPLFAVPPSSATMNVRLFVPLELVATVNVRVPLPSTTGACA